MDNNKKTTIYDIAKITNLSIATVSRIINNKGGYSKATEELVLNTIKSLSYSPSSSAQNLASSVTRTIGLVLNILELSYSTDEFSLQFLSGVTIAASQYGYDILLDNNILNYSEATHSLLNRQRYDGIIFSHIDTGTLNLVENLISHQFPIVYSGSKLESDVSGYNIYGGYNYYKKEVLELLYHLGHRNIVVFEAYKTKSNFLTIEKCRQIVNRFREDYQLNEQQCRMLLYDAMNNNQFQLLLHDILLSENPPQSICIDSIKTATLAYNVIQSLNLRIPEDISVISTAHFNRSGEEFSPTLSVIHVNAFEMGKRAVDLLVKQIEKKEIEVDTYVPYQIINRKSVQSLIPISE